MEVVINLKDGRKVTFDVESATVTNNGNSIIINEVVPAKEVSLAAVIKSVRMDSDVLKVIKLVKASVKMFNDVVNVLEMHAVSGIKTAQAWRKEHFKENTIMALFAIRGYTCAEAKKKLAENDIGVVLNNSHYYHLIKGIRGWEVVRELLKIDVSQKQIDRAGIKEALDSGMHVNEVMRMFNVSNSIVYEIKNGRKYTPRL